MTDRLGQRPRPGIALFSLRIVTVLVGVMLTSLAHARQGAPPYSLTARAKASIEVPIEEVARIDALAIRAMIDASVRTIGPRQKRRQVAIGTDVSINPSRNGLWTTLPDGSMLWRVKIRARGATDLRFGFSRYVLPVGTSLHVIGAGDYFQGPYLAADAFGGRFQSPAVPGDTAMIELHLPSVADWRNVDLQLETVGAGFRPLFSTAKADAGDLGGSGACNVNVACPVGQAYSDEIRAVAQYEVQSDLDRDYYACTGTLVSDVARDRRNYFVTAAHCVTSDSEAATMVLYWNYQSTQCDRLEEPAAGWFNDDQHGATLRARREDVDFSLVELNQVPDPAWHVYYAGWDASGDIPFGTVGIHHPSADVKKITVGPAPATTGNCLGVAASAQATHWSTGPYIQGTTESGSSGSGLFASNTAAGARPLIGILSGGDAACSSATPSQPNGGTDCYGKLAIAWDGPATSSRLRDWLDPDRTGAFSVDGVDSAWLPIARGHSHHAIPAIVLRNRDRR